MTEAAALSVPLGQSGSGRLRYGAAMALYGEGKLSAEALEVYRICSSRDADDPGALLQERGLPVPKVGSDDASGAIRLLIDEADRYLSALQGPGLAEARAGISAARSGQVRPLPPHETEVVAAYLATALDQLEKTHAALASAVAIAAPLLDWVTYDAYPRDQIGDAFATGHAFASLIGAEAPVVANDFDFGLFLIAPHVLYRDRCHRASELYAPLTGPHGWRFGPDTPLVLKPAHVPVWNEPFRPHLTKVGAVPFLSLFCWTRDVDEPARVLNATDWPGLEALRIGEGDD